MSKAKLTLTGLLESGQLKLVRPGSAITEKDNDLDAKLFSAYPMSVTQKQLVDLDTPLPYQRDVCIWNMTPKQRDADLVRHIKRLSKPFASYIRDEEATLRQWSFCEREVIAESEV